VSTYKVQSYAQQLGADAFGADQALFSTNGSTLSVQIAVMAVTHPGQAVAVARNVHKSVISGLILSGAHPVFVDPIYDDEYALAHAVTPEALEKALDAHPEVKGDAGGESDGGGRADRRSARCPASDCSVLSSMAAQVSQRATRRRSSSTSRA
jgi:hypothetical protein